LTLLVLKTTGQIEIGLYLDTSGTSLQKKCGELQLKKNDKFRFDVWTQNGSCWANKEIRYGAYSIQADTLILRDTLFTDQKKDISTAAIRQTFYIHKDGRDLIYKKTVFTNEEKYLEECRRIYGIKASSKLEAPLLKSCGTLTRHK
jgi:hypothetical protein